MVLDKHGLSRLAISLLFGLTLAGITLFTFANHAQLTLAGNCQVPGGYATIQNALQAQTCDTIEIAPGIYTETLLITRSVSLRGAGPEATILDGLEKDRPVTINGFIGEHDVLVSLIGMRITNGVATSASSPSQFGGGVLVTGNAVLLGENLQIDSNIASSASSGYGGGLAVSGASAYITDTVVISNTANQRPGQSIGSGYGGGLYVKNGVLHLFHSQVINNLASYRAGSSFSASGGGLYLDGNVVVDLRENIWQGNIARGSMSSACKLIDCSDDVWNEGGGAIGVFLEAGTAAVTVTGDTFVGNISNNVDTFLANSGRGGAISFNTSDNAWISATLTGVTFEKNIAARKSLDPNEEGRGGAIYARHTDLMLDSALLFENYAALEGNGSGGGIFVRVPHEDNTFELQNSILAGNVACAANDCGDGAQVYIDYSNPIPNEARIVHTTIVDNGLNPRQGIYYFAPFSGDQLYITNTIITSHTVGVEIPEGEGSASHILFYGNTVTRTGGGTLDFFGILSGQPDPQFVDPEDGDYHIQSGSPAIDNGSDAGIAHDFEGDSRPQGNGFDIGADEFLVSLSTKTPTVTPSLTPRPSSSPTPTDTPVIPSTSVPPGKKIYLPLVIRKN